MRTLVLSFGRGHISLRPAAGEMFVLDSIAGCPRQHAQAEHVTLTAIPRTLLGVSLPQRLNRALQVPAEFDRIIIQSAGAAVRSENISWASVRLEGVASRFACLASRLGSLELVGAAQHARERAPSRQPPFEGGRPSGEGRPCRTFRAR